MKPTSPQPPDARIAAHRSVDAIVMMREHPASMPSEWIALAREAHTAIDVALRTERAAARTAGCEAQRIVMVDLFRKLLKWASPPGDWACIKCRPQSDMIKAGFLCAWHEAEAEIERTPEQPTTKRCPTCRSDDRHIRLAPVMSDRRICYDDDWHPQPTTGEAGK